MCTITLFYSQYRWGKGSAWFINFDKWKNILTFYNKVLLVIEFFKILTILWDWMFVNKYACTLIS